MLWTGVCIPSGFSYHCLPSTLPLLSQHQASILASTIPFGPDITTLALLCKQTYAETALLPFQRFVWAFETPWTLDQWLSMKRSGMRQSSKRMLRTVAVPMPGVFQGCERAMEDLVTVLLVGSFRADGQEIDGESVEEKKVGILVLRRARGSVMWVRGQTWTAEKLTGCQGMGESW